MSHCQICRTEYERKYLTQKTCLSVECKTEQKRQEAIKKTKRAEYRVAKERLKTRSDYLKEVQIAFNNFIRLRDAAFPCISCGRFHGGQYHSGHFRSVGASPELRFNEYNAHKQCAPCNNHKSGNILEYRIRLVQKIGLKRVEWLEGKHEPKKYTIDELKALKIHYRAMIKGLIIGNVD